MGISNELSEFEGLNPSILVKLGNANIKTIDNTSDLIAVCMVDFKRLY